MNKKELYERLKADNYLQELCKDFILADLAHIHIMECANANGRDIRRAFCDWKEALEEVVRHLGCHRNDWKVDFVINRTRDYLNEGYWV